MSNDTDSAVTELTVTVIPVFTVPELPGETEFTSYEDAVNTAAITLGVGARFSVNRINEVDAVEALVQEATYTGPQGAAPTPPVDPPVDPQPAEVPDATDDPTAPAGATSVAPSVPSGTDAGADTDGGVVVDTTGSDAGAGTPVGTDGSPAGSAAPANGDAAPAGGDAAPADGDGGEAGTDSPVQSPAPIVTGDDTDPTDAPVQTVGDVPSDAGDVQLGQPQEQDQPVFTPAPDASTIVSTDPPPWPVSAPATTDVPPVDTTNAIFDPSPTAAPTAAPADDTSPTESAPTTDS